VDLGQHPALGAAAGITLWAYGVAFVTCRWAIEATAFARVRAERITWSAQAGQAREHLLGLVRWLPALVGARSFTDPRERSATSWAALRGRTPVLAPWNLAVIVAGAAAALTGRLLVGSPTAVQAAVAAALGGLAALVVVLAPRSTGRAAGVRLLAVFAGAAVLVATLLVQAADAAAVALLPWLAVLLAYAYFTNHSMRTMGRWGRWLRGRFGELLAPVARLTIGDETWSALARTERVDG
jgi:hypothetical protein